ncbi:hypothetical protein BFS30_05945 [Pedobacter steynii]|uniref:Uncharacterized protein n=1 Tax=Pedobacter steynii TaxID=430522 RepID=A0A1D7QDG1_9SPHI|nr:hypothetical protein BFS30_05945 [Pedobacter steynii]
MKNIHPKDTEVPSGRNILIFKDALPAFNPPFSGSVLKGYGIFDRSTFFFPVPDFQSFFWIALFPIS